MGHDRLLNANAFETNAILRALAKLSPRCCDGKDARSGPCLINQLFVSFDFLDGGEHLGDALLVENLNFWQTRPS